MELIQTLVHELGRIFNTVVGAIVFMVTVMVIPFGFLFLLLIQGLVKLLDIVIGRLDRKR